MRIVFMGTPEFSAEFLRHLIKSEHEVVAVATQPDKQSGRGMELHSPPVKIAALENGIPVLQPALVKSQEFADELKKFDADIFVVVAFSILSKEVLAASRLGAINIHGSLLPKYRGAAPVQWAIASCEQVTGLTVFLLDEKMDHGPVLEQRKLKIEQNDTTESLLKKMVAPGCNALDSALAKLQNKNFMPIEQNHEQASPAPKLKKENGLIDWNMSALQIHKRLCAFTPWPGAYTNLNGQKIFLRKTDVLENENNCPKKLKPGEILMQKNAIFSGTKNGILVILEVQAEGKKRMPAADYFRGVSGSNHCFTNSLLCLIFIFFAFAFADTERVTGANSSLEATQGAKSAALGGVALPVLNDLPSLAQNPLQLSSVEKLSLAFTHVSYFEETSYNGAVISLPLRESGVLGFAASRYGASDIPYIKEGDPLPDGDDYNTLNISDWIFTSAWAKNFGKWNLAFSLHLLKRELDQSGWGFRSDIAAGYEFSKKFMLAGMVKGWTSSAVKWESGYFEYSSPGLYAAFRFSEPFPYFYGNLNLYWQSAEILHSESEEETRAWQNPVNWFLASNAGLEFETDFSLSLRAGLVKVSDANGLTLGAGIKPLSRLLADYAFEMHGELSSVHRISITALF